MLPTILIPGLATIHRRGAEPIDAQPFLRRGRVLVLESDDALREAIVNALGTVVAVTGQAAGRELLLEIDVGRISTVIISLQPRDMNGEHLLRLIRERLPAAKVIVTSTSGDHDLVRRVTDMGVCDFLEKPFGIDDLYQAMERAQRGNAVPLDPHSLSVRRHEKSRTRRMAVLAYTHIGGEIGT